MRTTVDKITNLKKAIADVEDDIINMPGEGEQAIDTDAGLKRLASIMVTVINVLGELEEKFRTMPVMTAPFDII